MDLGGMSSVPFIAAYNFQNDCRHAYHHHNQCAQHINGVVFLVRVACSSCSISLFIRDLFERNSIASLPLSCDEQIFGLQHPRYPEKKHPNSAVSRSREVVYTLTRLVTVLTTD